MSARKLFVAMAASGLCMSAATAGHMGEDVMLPAAPPTVNVTIPQYIGSWMVALEAKYQQQNNGDFHYAATSDSQTNVPVLNMTQTDRKVHAVEPESDWGGAIELGYNFEGNGRDVRLNWTHHHDSESDHTDRQSGSTLLGVGFVSDSVGLFNMATAPRDTNVGTDWDEVKGDSRNDYDHIDLVFGQSMDFGQKVTLRAFGGLRYADIDNRDKAHYRTTATSGTSAGAQEIADLRLKSDFSGLGPRAGMDAQVRLGSGFSVVGTVAGSVLAGSFDQKFSVDQRVLGETAGAVESGTYDEHKISGKHRVVPELDARLGLNYSFAFTQETGVQVEIGYEVMNYFDVKDTSLVSYFDTQGHDSDFGMNGLYLRAQLDLA